MFKSIEYDMILKLLCVFISMPNFIYYSLISKIVIIIGLVDEILKVYTLVQYSFFNID